jgi:signal transduction histidine kinase
VAVTTGSLVQDHLVHLRQHAEAGTATRGLVRRVVGDAELAAALMVENLRRAADLVCAFKQVAVDRGDVTVRAARLEEWIRALLHSLSPLARNHRVTLVVDVPMDANLVLAAGELEQIVTNLVVNGCVHAYPETGGSALDRRVELSARYDDAALVIEVKDRGRGMMPEEVAHVFEPFYTTRRGQGGTGLGMHVVHQLVRERFDGTIGLDTAPGAGTRWTVRLPFETTALRLLGVPSSSGTPQGVERRDGYDR